MEVALSGLVTMLSRFSLIAGLILTALSGAAASPFVDAAERLDGEWRGDGFVLKIDSHRAQASVDPERPFQWQRFLVREVTEDEVVFAVGAELFEARMDAGTLTLTGTTFRGARILRQAPEP